MKKLLLSLLLLLSSLTPIQAQEGVVYASWYNIAGITASGKIYNPNGFTAAYNYLPLKTKVKITNIKNNKSVIVWINDRTCKGNKRIDLTPRAFRQIADLRQGIIKVKMEVM